VGAGILSVEESLNFLPTGILLTLCLTTAKRWQHNNAGTAMSSDTIELHICNFVVINGRVGSGYFAWCRLLKVVNK
jgi:hypothetical protein